MIGAGETGPFCGECRSPLDQLLQLKVSDLPSAYSTLKGEGVLQLFRCSAADCDADDHEPFSASHLVRLVPEQALFGGLGAANRPPPLPQREIRGWERFDDHPSSAEHERCGIKYERVFEPGVTITSVRWAEGNVAIYGIREPNSGGGILEGSISPACAAFDKLGGWPAWSQGVEYPSCPKCDAEMRSVFQLASRDNLPIELGDLGVGHITQCPKHPSVLAFSWAS